MEEFKRVLYVNSQMCPYTAETPLALMGRTMPSLMQEKKIEVRIFMPRYGSVNERKFQLHEVIRLFGMNIVVGGMDRPLVIKVASVPSSRMQVYFIDNEDYFHRKGLDHSLEGEFFPDNAERAIFYAKGVLETVKKLRWAPDIIHCSGWISYVLPLYLKKIYKDDPIFSSSKVVLSVDSALPKEAFQDDFASKVLCCGLKSGDFALEAGATGADLLRESLRYADGVVIADDDVDDNAVEICRKSGVKCLPFDTKASADGSFNALVGEFYKEI